MIITKIVANEGRYLVNEMCLVRIGEMNVQFQIVFQKVDMFGQSDAALERLSRSTRSDEKNEHWHRVQLSYPFPTVFTSDIKYESSRKKNRVKWMVSKPWGQLRARRCCFTGSLVATIWWLGERISAIGEAIWNLASKSIWRSTDLLLADERVLISGSDLEWRVLSPGPDTRRIFFSKFMTILSDLLIGLSTHGFVKGSHFIRHFRFEWFPLMGGRASMILPNLEWFKVISYCFSVPSRDPYLDVKEHSSETFRSRFSLFPAKINLMWNDFKWWVNVMPLRRVLNDIRHILNSLRCYTILWIWIT